MITNESTFDRSHPAGFQRNISRRALLSAGAAGAISATAIGGLTVSAAQQGESTPTPGRVLDLPLYPYGQPLYLDPHRATNWGPHWVLLPHVWAGLLRFDEQGAVITDLAVSIEPEQDGQTWVAEIRSDATFASGNPVTAQTLIQGWMRALDPQHLAPTSQFMSRVDGFDAFIAGESDEIGFEARSETTVAINLAEPYALFPEELAAFVWAAVDVAALEGVAGSDVPYADAAAGLWRFAPSEDASLIQMVPNPNAQGDLPGTIDEVIWHMFSGAQGAEVALSQFESNALAIADIPSPLRRTVEQNEVLADQLRTIPLSGSTMLIGMDFNQEPFDDIRVRQAVAASINSATWATDIQGGAFVEAASITPPVLVESANYSAPEPITFDPELARSLVAEAGIEEAEQPPITWHLPANATEAERDQAAALVEMVRTNSGLVIELDTTLTAEQIDALRNDNDGLQFDLRWWWPFTSSPSGLAELAGPESDGMAGWFNWSPELQNEDAAAAAEVFASLITEAASMMDSTERMQTYAEAEQILVDNAVYIPLGHGVQAFVQSPSLTGTVQGSFTGYAPLLLNSDVVFDPTTATPEG